MHLSHIDMLKEQPVLRNTEHFEEVLIEVQQLRKIQHGGQGLADKLLRDNGILEMKVWQVDECVVPNCIPAVRINTY